MRSALLRIGLEHIRGISRQVVLGDGLLAVPSLAADDVVRQVLGEAP